MISMTGFGRAAVAVGTRRVVAEVRSVNSRGLEVKVRGRGLSAAAEVDTIRFVRTRCSRGSVQVSIDEERDPHSPEDRDRDDLSPERLQALHARLEGLRQTLGGLDGNVVDFTTLLAFARLERERTHVAVAAPEPLRWEDVQPAVEEAIDQLQAFRATEGESLAAELRDRAAHLGQLLEQVKTRLPATAERARQRLSERLAALATTLGGDGTKIDPGRLAQEAAILADRLDVSEEMARLDAHLARLADLLRSSQAQPPGGDRARSSGEGVGRPLEFLLQEIGRELNTLGTKAQDADISTLVIASKAELEKIREQAQNIE